MQKSEAVSHFGSQRKLAEALGISQPSVAGWGDLVPLGRAFLIERLTGGKLKVNVRLYQRRKSGTQ